MYSVFFHKTVGAAVHVPSCAPIPPTLQTLLADFRKLSCKVEPTPELRSEQFAQISKHLVLAQLHCPKEGSQTEFVATKGQMLSALRDLTKRYLDQGQIEAAQTGIEIGLRQSKAVDEKPNYFQLYFTKFTELSRNSIVLKAGKPSSVTPQMSGVRVVSEEPLLGDKKCRVFESGKYHILDSFGLLEKEGQVPEPFSYVTSNQNSSATLTYTFLGRTPVLTTLRQEWPQGVIATSTYSYSRLSQGPVIQLDSVIKVLENSALGKRHTQKIRFGTDPHSIPLELLKSEVVIEAEEGVQKQAFAYPSHHFFLREDGSSITQRGIDTENIVLNDILVSFGSNPHQIPLDRLPLLYRCFELAPGIGFLLFKGPRFSEERWIVSNASASPVNKENGHISTLSEPESKRFDVTYSSEEKKYEFFLSGTLSAGNRTLKYSITATPDENFLCDRLTLRVTVSDKEAGQVFKGLTHWKGRGQAPISFTRLLKLTAFQTVEGFGTGVGLILSSTEGNLPVFLLEPTASFGQPYSDSESEDSDGEL